MRLWHALFAGVLALGLSGCLQATLVNAHKPQLAAERYTVQPASAWNRITGFGNEIWTKDGLGLQELHFYDPTADGSPLFSRPDGKQMPTFQAGMRANDIADFYAATMLANGNSVADTSNLRPFRFSGQRGFRFNIDIVTQTGTRYRGEAFGAVIDKKLHLVVYVGHEEFYYEQSRTEVEQLMQSLTLKSA